MPVSFLKVRGIEARTISRRIVSCDIAWYGIWAISRYIMRYHTGSPRNNRQTNLQTRSCLVLFVWALCLCHLHGLPFLSSFCCPLSGHIIGLTATPAKKTATLCPASSACSLSACMFFFICLCFFPFTSFLPCIFCLVGTLSGYPLITRHVVFLLT